MNTQGVLLSYDSVLTDSANRTSNFCNSENCASYKKKKKNNKKEQLVLNYIYIIISSSSSRSLLWKANRTVVRTDHNNKKIVY